ncbi:hypothetical protein NDU88_005626 [Pleurodeles waltl]|uniref:Uncharacterized protein n=1 Tax=Pleurodeles waltl TaxID=8319 RepID=A0AAV7TVZ7_PLEWA|nr:hypothetical protein NDU88_005626 [Pleurodeles waltl]
MTPLASWGSLPSEMRHCDQEEEQVAPGDSCTPIPAKEKDFTRQPPGSARLLPLALCTYSSKYSHRGARQGWAL